MTNSFSHETFLSPFTWRYGSDSMRQIWSEHHKRRLWRKIWVALSEVQHSIGLVTADQVADLRQHQNDIDLNRAHEIESQIHHDLMAEVRTYAEQCPVGGGVIHLGATSMDIEDNAEALRIRESLQLLLYRLQKLLSTLADRIDHEADHICMAFTHLQPAEPTTIGYRLAGYAQDLLADLQTLRHITTHLRGKGFKGAVGTSASYAELLKGTTLSPHGMESQIMAKLELPAFLIATQTYTRRQDWEVISAIAGLGLTIYRLAFDIRILQSPVFGEWSEPFGKSQVGSSAMPFKRNPINAENIDSLARYLATLPRVAWDNAAHNLLERTLDDSANRRLILPEAFLSVEEIILRADKLLSGLRIDERAVRQNLDRFGVFAATERVLMAASRHGANRQDLHERIREHSLAAWEALKQGQPNPLSQLIQQDPHLLQYLSSDQLQHLLNAESYVGDAPERARALAQHIRQSLTP